MEMNNIIKQLYSNFKKRETSMNDVKSLTHEWVQPICLKLMKASTGFLSKKILSEDEYVWHALNDKAPGSY